MLCVRLFRSLFIVDLPTNIYKSLQETAGYTKDKVDEQ